MSAPNRLRAVAVVAWRALALAFTGALFLIGGPIVSASAFGLWHDLIHVVTFAALAILYALAWPRVHWLRIALGTLALGATHELYQFALNRQQFESDDFALNCAGVACATALRLLVATRQRNAV